MKISLQNKISFQRNLTQKEMDDYSQVLQEAKDIVGQKGKSIFIMPSACLPEDKKSIFGIGNLSSEYTQEYFEFLKKFWVYFLYMMLENVLI